MERDFFFFFFTNVTNQQVANRVRIPDVLLSTAADKIHCHALAHLHWQSTVQNITQTPQS